MQRAIALRGGLRFFSLCYYLLVLEFVIWLVLVLGTLDW